MQTAGIAEMGERGAEVIGQKLVEFCHLLSAHGIRVTAGRIIDAFRSLRSIDVFRRDDFYTVLEANMVSHADERALFRQLFLQFWSGPTWALPPDPCVPAWEDGCTPPPAVLQPLQAHVESWEV